MPATDWNLEPRRYVEKREFACQVPPGEFKCGTTKLDLTCYYPKNGTFSVQAFTNISGDLYYPYTDVGTVTVN